MNSTVVIKKPYESPLLTTILMQTEGLCAPSPTEVAEKKNVNITTEDKIWSRKVDEPEGSFWEE